jgi:hypothetical protein
VSGRSKRHEDGGSCSSPPTLAACREQAGVVDDLAFEEPVELFGVDPVGSFYLAVQPRGAGFDLDVVDAEVE